MHLKTLSIWVIHNSFFKILLIVWSWNWNNFWNHQNCCFLLLLFSIWFAHLITIGLLLFAFLYWHKFCAESNVLSGNLSQKRENNEPIPFLLKNCCGIFSKKWNWRSLPFLFHCFPMTLCCLIKHHWVLLFHEFEAAGNKTENDFITKIFSQAFLHLEMFYNTLFHFLSFCRIWTIQKVASVTYNIPFQSNDFLKLSKANFSSTTVVTMFSDFVILSTSWLVLIVHVWCQCIIFSEVELEDSKGKLLLEDKLHNIGCFCSSFNIFSKHLIRCFCRNETQDSPKRTFARNQLL